MTEKEIIENNRLIAEFMGDYRAKYKVSNDHTLANAMLKTLKYHSSWDWLMPVVAKIEHFDNRNTIVDIVGACCTIKTFRKSTTKYDMPIFEVLHAESKMEAVWLAVVEFIKWWNEKVKL